MGRTSRDCLIPIVTDNDTETPSQCPAYRILPTQILPGTWTSMGLDPLINPNIHTYDHSLRTHSLPTIRSDREGS